MKFLRKKIISKSITLNKLKWNMIINAYLSKEKVHLISFSIKEILFHKGLNFKNTINISNNTLFIILSFY